MDYQKIYNNIIKNAREQNRTKSLDIYYEAHHIIPKCLGGEGYTRQWKSHPNIILLTPKEHFLCHLLLCEIYPKSIKLYQALWLMSTNKNKKEGKRYKISSRTYSRIKNSVSLFYRNRIQSPEEITKRKISQKERWYKKLEELGLIINEENIEKFHLLYPNIEVSESNKHCINYCFNKNIKLENIICSCGKGIKSFQNYTQGYKQYCSKKCANFYNKDKALQTKETKGLWDKSKIRSRKKEIENLSEEQIKQLKSQKISSKLKGRKVDWTGYPIIQYDLEGNFIKEWSSIRQAGFELSNTQGEPIRKCLKGFQKTAYGFKWKYKK